MNLVMVPFHDWRKCEREGFRTRDAHLMEEFARHPQVGKLLVVNRPLSWSEMALRRRPRATPGGRRIVRCGHSILSQMSDKVFVLDILVPEVVRPLWLRRRWTAYIMGTDRVSDATTWAMDHLKISTAPWSFLLGSPLFAPLIEKTPQWPFSFDADDNLLKHSMYRRVPKLQEYYDYCLEHADAVFTNSQENRDWFLPRRKDALWIPNGVSTDRFRPGVSHPLPRDMIGIRRPVVGYAGHMQEMVDVEGTLKVVRALPDVSFVFIGRRLSPRWVAPLWKEPNCHYLGDKRYQELPSYLAAFDVCFIPYSPERQHGGDPLKFYEYLAMGKPTVTTNIGGVGKFADYPQVRITETVSEFLGPLSHFIDSVKHGRQIVQRPVPTECEWKTKADMMLQTMKQRLARRNAGSCQEGA